MKKLLALAIIFSFISLCFGQIKKNCSGVELTLCPEIEITCGKLGEYLYTKDQQWIVSALEWEEKPLVKSGISGNLNFGNFNISGSSLIGIPGKCGIMTDSDWIVSEFKTNYGIFENQGNVNFEASARISYDFFWEQHFSFSPVATFRFKYDSFTGSEGYGWYGDEENTLNGKLTSWDSEYAKKVKLLNIDYKRKTYLFFVGFSEAVYFNRFRAGFSLLLSPYQRFYATDFHHGKTTYDEEGNVESDSSFTTITWQTAYFETINGNLFFEYNLSSKVALSCKIDLVLSNLIKGQTVSNHDRRKGFGMLPDVEWELLKQKSGADAKEVNLNFGCNIKI